ncbi:glycosyl hydrolase family 28-related protein [Roseibacterium sp. SDUM158017]|uniref:glycosyl hydrolase family 28-related protein n=1 Tax=Roseicyclus salinarum TaxID=3036773 RepID=UPI0024152282|nr:glycosyl hydrolase family 28-related protein [Roseibacterium sp. SDUM158017]MDG4647964.1 glycosyl hydrolase family 28-related protein [Roseibacterium sp. SDUM158017]
MNQVITDGLALMPPAFSEGLAAWSRQDGTPGSDTWATAANATLVAADADFGACLEVVKTDSVTQIRHMGQTPMRPGMYLRVSARLKVLSGSLPEARIAGWAGDAGGAQVAGVTASGPTVTPAGYGEVVTVSAILGSGARGGVDMVWGEVPVYGHLGIDLTGPNSGQVRIESVRIEDVTHVFHRKMMDWVDVLDFGAVGDGVTDDRAAFIAADAAAAGREVLVPAGTYLIGDHLTMSAPVRFEGSLVMPPHARLALQRNYDLDGYSEAFGDDVEGLRKGLQILFNSWDFEAFDLCGRRVMLDAPIDVQAVVGNKNTYANRRVIRNGQLSADESAGWADEVHTRTASWSSGAPLELSNVANAASIPVGALVTGAQGVGREVYVSAVNAAQGRVTLSAPLWGAPAQQDYGFTRFRYLLDFSGFLNLQRFVVSDIEFLCAGRCSGLMLPVDGLVFQVRDCFFTAPKDRGITSPGEGCQGMQIDRCQFLSNEQTLRVQDRASIAFNANASDVKVRDNRAVKFLHFGILGGAGNILTGNHFFQGDDETDGLRSAGLILTRTNAKTTFTGNYVDNCFVEWGNEHDPEPAMQGEFSFHGLTANANIFFASNATPFMKFILIKPYGPDHYLNGISICDNLFKETNGPALEAVEGVDASVAPLDLTRANDVLFAGNTFHGVTKRTENPVVRRVVENTASQVWSVDLSDALPFGCEAQAALSVIPDGAVRNAANASVFTMPYATARAGSGGRSVQLTWSEPVRGAVHLSARCDS